MNESNKCGRLCEMLSLNLIANAYMSYCAGETQILKKRRSAIIHNEIIE